MPYQGEVSKYRIPAPHAASRAVWAAWSLTATGKLPIGAQPKPALVIGSRCGPMLTRCAEAGVIPFFFSSRARCSRLGAKGPLVSYSRLVERGGHLGLT